MTKIFTTEELSELCRKWQELLGLSHWHIGVQLRRIQDMPHPVSQATNEISLENEQSLIKIVDPQDFPIISLKQDVEVSLVHELLHIPTRYFIKPDENTLEHTLMEAFIERTARLLVSLSRKADRKLNQEQEE